MCGICGEAGELVCCEGRCKGAFHVDCIGLAKIPAGMACLPACLLACLPACWLAPFLTYLG